MKVSVVMDPMAQVNPKKDSSFALMLAAQNRGMEVFHIAPENIKVQDGEPWAKCTQLRVQDDPANPYEVLQSSWAPLTACGILFIRKDPPFDAAYLYLTYMLELAQQQGAVVVNRPQSLRDCNEKFFINQFQQCIPPTLVTGHRDVLLDFIQAQQEVIIKPLDGMGGASIFYVQAHDKNKQVILEMVTQHGQLPVMAQRFIPQVSEGDRRIIMIDGEPMPYALARIPQGDDIRGNLAAGGMGVGVALTDRDRWICQQVGPALRERGLVWVGLDVIGDYLTEINVTSPTCVRELDALYDLSILDHLLDVVASC
jgi:glutathione synthase